MAAVEIKFTTSALRQPGMWGKVLIPWTGGIHEFSVEKGFDLSISGNTRTITFPDVADGAYLVLGIRGYHGAGGHMIYVYLLMKVQSGFFFDWQVPGHLSHFECKGVRMMEKSEEGLQPLYESLKMFKYEHIDRLIDFLRKEGIDKSSQAPAAAAPQPAAGSPPAPSA